MNPNDIIFHLKTSLNSLKRHSTPIPNSYTRVLPKQFKFKFRAQVKYCMGLRRLYNILLVSLTINSNKRDFSRFGFLFSSVLRTQGIHTVEENVGE